MHARPYTDVFNDNVVKMFQHYVKQYPGIQFCTAAHTHHYRDDVILMTAYTMLPVTAWTSVLTWYLP